MTQLFALIEDISDCDCGGEEGIVMLFENELEITNYLMERLKDKFENHRIYYYGQHFKWESTFEFPYKPKICMIETNKHYSPFDFNTLADFNKYIDKNNPIFEVINTYNIDVEQNSGKYEQQKKLKELENKKRQLEELRNDIKKLEGQ